MFLTLFLDDSNHWQIPLRLISFLLSYHTQVTSLSQRRLFTTWSPLINLISTTHHRSFLLVPGHQTVLFYPLRSCRCLFIHFPTSLFILLMCLLSTPQQLEKKVLYIFIYLSNWDDACHDDFSFPAWVINLNLSILIFKFSYSQKSGDHCYLSAQKPNNTWLLRNFFNLSLILATYNEPILKETTINN